MGIRIYPPPIENGVAALGRRTADGGRRHKERGALMKYQKILVPYDGSEHAMGAFTAGRDLALMSEESTLYVLNVLPMSATLTLHATESITSGSSPLAKKEYAEKIEESLHTIEGEMKDELKGLYDGLPEERIHIEAIAHPSPVHGIAEYAENHDCDIIVIGRRGLGAVRGMLGSVSYGVLRAVDIPVLAVK